jgi:hypothetical protein
MANLNNKRISLVLDLGFRMLNEDKEISYRSVVTGRGGVVVMHTGGGHADSAVMRLVTVAEEALSSLCSEVAYSHFTQSVFVTMTIKYDYKF